MLPANTLTLINADIGPSLNINWVGTSWTLGSSIGFLLFGRLSDIFGRKHLVIAAQILGTVGCIVGATAGSINMLIGSNLLNGIAAAGQLSFGIVIGELVPNKLRGPAITIIFLSSLPFAGLLYSLQVHPEFSLIIEKYLGLQLLVPSSSTLPRSGDGLTISESSATHWLLPDTLSSTTLQPTTNSTCTANPSGNNSRSSTSLDFSSSWPAAFSS